MLSLIPTAYAVGLPTFTSQNLPVFIQDVYSFSLTIVGVAIFIQFLRAGFKYLTGGAYPAEIGKANDMMKNAVIGAVLLFSAYLILNVINPDLVKNSFNFSIPALNQTAPENAPQKIETAPIPASESVAIAGTPTGTTGQNAGKSNSWTANADEGIFPVKFTATDANGDSCTKVFNLEIVQNVVAPSSFMKTRELSLFEKLVAKASNDCTSVQFMTQSLPTAFVNEPYFAEVRAFGGRAPYVYSVGDSGSASLLKRGLALLTTGAVNAATTTPKPEKFRFLRIDSTMDGWVGWREIEIFDKDGNKITPVNATANCNMCGYSNPSAEDMGGPKAVYDGDPGLIWNAGETAKNCSWTVSHIRNDGQEGIGCAESTQRTAAITIDLGESKEVSKIRLLHYGDRQNETDTLLASDDGRRYREIGSFKTTEGSQFSDLQWLEWTPTEAVATNVESGGATLPALLPITSALPKGLSLQVISKMPILTIENKTAKREPIFAFYQTDTFELKLTNAKPSSKLFIKWIKNGEPWYYPGKEHTSDGWTDYGMTDGNGEWLNKAKFTPEQLGNWQEQAMVDGNASRVIAFQVLDPTIRIQIAGPTGGPIPGSVPVGGAGVYGGGSSFCQTVRFCEDRITGAQSDILTDAETHAQGIAGGGSDRCPGKREVSICTFPRESAQLSKCDRFQFEQRSCLEEKEKRRKDDGTYDTSNIPHSTDGTPAYVPPGTLYTVDQYAGDTRLGSGNFLTMCRYHDQARAGMGGCGGAMSGEYCIGNNYGYNQRWCVGQVDANGKLVNPPAAPPILQRGADQSLRGRGGTQNPASIPLPNIPNSDPEPSAIPATSTPPNPRGGGSRGR